MSDVLLEVENIKKDFWAYSSGLRRLGVCLGVLERNNKDQVFNIIKGISFELLKGECLGIIGPNGAGKSTLLKIITGCLSATSGSVACDYRILSLLELGAGFNYDLTGRENIYSCGLLLGYSKVELDSVIDEIEDFADIGLFFDQKIKLFSSGMLARLGFSMYSHLPCDVLVVDEVFSVGDVFFVQKCYHKMESLLKAGKGILLVSHDMNTITKFCRKSLVLSQGEQAYYGVTREAVSKYYFLENAEFVVSHEQKTVQKDKPISHIESLSEWPKASESTMVYQEKFQNSNFSHVNTFFLCDQDFKARNNFEPGDICVIAFEVEIKQKSFGTPIGSVVIWNEKNIAIYGKSSYQFTDWEPYELSEGGRIRFMYRIPLDLAEGAYTIEVGIAGLPLGRSEFFEQMSNEQINANLIHDAVCNQITAFSIQSGSVRSSADMHHGIMNLNASLNVHIDED